MSRPIATPTAEQLEEYLRKSLKDHDSRVALIFAVEIPMIVLTVGVVAVRFYARTRIKKTLGSDDWMMGLAAVFAIVLTTLNCVAAKYGAGRHLWDIDLSKVGITGGKLAYIYAVLFTPAVVFAKMSICMTYLRIFPKRSDRLFAKGVIWWLILTGIGCTVAMIVPCIPIEAYWDLKIPEKKCYNARLGLVITSALNTTTDLAVFLWPAPRLFSLRLPLAQRLGLVFVFSIGCLTCAAGIARMWFLGAHYYKSQDIFYNLAVLYVLSSLDCNLGILCGSLPEVRVFFSPAFDKIGYVINTKIRRKPSDPSRGSQSSKLPRGVLSPNAYDLEKSVRPRPDLDEDLRDESLAPANSRQVSINIMLDESTTLGGRSSRSPRPEQHNSQQSHNHPHHHHHHSSRHSHAFGLQSLSPTISSPDRRAEVTESKFSN